MKSIRAFAVLATLALLMAFAPAASAASAYSVANLQGKYLFQMQGTTNSYGYSTCDTSGNCTWVDVNGPCPSTQNCGSSSFTKFSFGYIMFDGAGKITFVAFVDYHPVGGPGPVTKGGTSYGTYTVAADGHGTLNVTGTGSPLNINIANVDPVTGIAGSMIVHQISNGDAGATEAGFAFHQ